MLTERELMALERALRGRPVLSVYLDARVADPAARASWRVALDAALDRIAETRHDATHADRAAFERAAEALRGATAPVAGTLGAPGWVAFVTADGVQRADDLPGRVAFGVYYQPGIRLTPAVRALAERRHAVVAVVDSRSARLYRYDGATLEHAGSIHAHAHVEPPSHMGTPPRRSFHTPTRGSTGTDAAEREHRAGRARMMRDVAARLARLAGESGWVLLGGTPGAAREARAALSVRPPERVLVVPALQIASTEAEIAERAAWGATELQQRKQVVEVRALLERLASGHGTSHADATHRALDAGAVRRLYVTPGFLERSSDEGETLLRAAIAERAAVEVVTGDAARLLDAEADGVGALLRFSQTSPVRARSHRKRDTWEAP